MSLIRFKMIYFWRGLHNNLSDLSLNPNRFQIMYKKMAKRYPRKQSNKKHNRKQGTDSKVIAEGKAYVIQAEKVIKKNRKEHQERQKELQRRIALIASRRIQPTHGRKKATKPKASTRRPVRAAVPSQPAIPGVVPVAVPAGRSASRASQVARAGSRGGTNNIVIEQELHDRLNRHGANIGQLNFSLRWWDPNDLDLHLTCPCGTHIFYGNKKCELCKGQLDIDMNVGMNMSLEPVEHIFFKNAPKGTYKFWVNYFHGPKEFGGVTGGQKSRYALSLHENLNQIFRYEDNVSNKQREIHYDYTV